MKKLTFAVLILPFLLASPSWARDDVGDYSLQELFENDKYKNKLGDEVAFYFGEQKYKIPSKKFGEYRTNKKTNAFGKSDKAACEWVMLSALIALRDRALQEGGNAVVNIKSNYKNNTTVSETTFQCGAGAIMAGVALIGDVVKID